MTNTAVLLLVNLCLGLVGFSWLLVRTSRRWQEYPDEIRLLLTLTLALFFGLLAVSMEMIIENNQTLRLALIISCVKIFALVVLFMTSTTKYRTGTRTANGNLGADQNKNIL